MERYGSGLVQVSNFLQHEGELVMIEIWRKLRAERRGRYQQVSVGEGTDLAFTIEIPNKFL